MTEIDRIEKYNKDKLKKGDYIFFVKGMYKGRYGKFMAWNDGDKKKQLNAELEDGRKVYPSVRSVIKINEYLTLDEELTTIIGDKDKELLDSVATKIKDKKKIQANVPLLPEEAPLDAEVEKLGQQIHNITIEEH